MQLTHREWMHLNDLIAEAGSIFSLFDVCESVLGMLQTIIPFDHGLFFFYDDTDLKLLKPFLFNVSERVNKEYFEYYYRIDDIRARAFNQPFPARSSDIMFYKEWDKKEYFCDFMKANDFYYQLKADIHYKDELLSSISLLRNKKSGDFTDKELFYISLLRPHLGNHMYKLMILKKQEKALKDHGLQISQIIDQNQKRYKLSNRETDVIELVIKGLTTEEISDKLHISRETVRKHFKNIFSKSTVRNKTELLAKLVGLLE
ncbi:MAG: helix-turn-helix transcriptional regulator [Clostridiales bacterium]|nr:helix-turn-helix transcriptional regulator [Clostridiales bacterium]MCF8022873.1 helix-turn-helix transcriptional regulator [Clostridiales bacterium]